MYVERIFTVPRPIESVFGYLADFTHTNEWDPGTVETVQSTGNGGVGTTYSNVSEFMGRKVELTYETITHTHPTELRFRGTNKTATATDWMRFRKISETATEIHYRADFEFKGVIKLIAPLVMRGKLDALADETVEKLTATLLADA